ncbi:hypothetical protein AB0L82_13680 [Nocardia sp. NPDC052001]|uniref:hypothetical protein n=1 Tax=unclassified Nocardia TaxID=2637762 RepID=UPI003442FB4F
MTFSKSGRIAIGALALVSVLGLSACGSGDKHEGKHAATTTAASKATTAAAQTNYPPVPTADDLNAAFQKVVDPSTPNEAKLELMQGVSSDPSLPQRLSDVYTQNNVSVKVTNVTDLGNGTLTADVQLALNGGTPQNAVVPFIAEDGKWKVQKEWICNMLSLGNQTSPACS